MNFAVTLRILGILLTLFSLTQLPPILVSLYYGDGLEVPFLIAFGILFSAGLLLWFSAFEARSELRIRDGFLVVSLFWILLGALGCIPFMLVSETSLSLTDAVFESVSGLTTTGSTVLEGLDNLPRSLLYYRQQLQWLGGLGIIAIALAVLPMLGIGGMQLYRAEAPGAVKDDKLLPRITETARALLYIYLSLTLACALAYLLAGMSLFDAIAHSFSTVSIGGFSTHDASIGFYESPLVDLVAIVFMLICGMNFALHFLAWQHRSLRHYLQDPELRFYLGLIAFISVLCVGFLIRFDVYPEPGEALLSGVFQVVSISTTTGFFSADFAGWPLFLPFLLFYTAIIGACAGSTGGGMKVIRILLIIKQGFRELEKLIHPNAVIPVKLGSQRVPDRVVESVWGFFTVYVMTYLILMLAMLGTGLDITTAFTGVGAALNNLGPGLGDVARVATSLPDPAKWIMCFAMVLGRVEIFTLLVLLSPHFWRR